MFLTSQAVALPRCRSGPSSRSTGRSRPRTTRATYIIIIIIIIVIVIMHHIDIVTIIIIVIIIISIIRVRAKFDTRVHHTSHGALFLGTPVYTRESFQA